MTWFTANDSFLAVSQVVDQLEKMEGMVCEFMKRSYLNIVNFQHEYFRQNHNFYENSGDSFFLFNVSKLFSEDPQPMASSQKFLNIF